MSGRDDGPRNARRTASTERARRPPGRLRALIAAAVALAVLVVVAAVWQGGGSGGSAASTVGSPSPAVAELEAPAEPTGSLPPIKLSGTGQRVTERFTVTDGLAVIRSACDDCREDFIVELLDDESQVLDVVVDRVGSYSGSRAVGMTKGEYRLQIDADAAWTVDITQPRNEPAADLPVAYAGDEDRVEGPFTAVRAAEVAGAHSGGGTFVVTLLNARGLVQDLVFNEAGGFDGSTVAQMADEGPYYVNVTAEGDWSLRISEP